jgi:ATP-dependent DNA helicase RecQ
LADFCSHYNLERITTFSALKFLEKEGYILLSDAFANPSKILILLNNEELYRFMVANKTYEMLLKTILRSYTGLFSEFTRIDEPEIGKRLTGKQEEVRKQLRKLHQMRVIHYEPQNTKPRVTFIKGRMDVRDLKISPENYLERKKFASKRVDAMKHYVGSQNKCRSLILLEYFGETNAVRCGQCDVCLERNKIDISKLEFDTVLQLIKPILEHNEITLKELIFKLKTNIPEKKIIKVTQWLIDNDKIVLHPDNETLTWKSKEGN